MRIEQENLTRLTARKIKKDVVKAIQQGDAVLDFSSVKIVDSSAVSVVLAWIRAAQFATLEPRLIEAPAKLLDLAKLYGVLGLIQPFCRTK
ncbi:MAG: STAS domain-containing protein [Duodenibacillus sp.]|nr:STAS domain-containing protein [Duodenibacillus sp.]